MAKKFGEKLIAQNKKAFFDYFIEETMEAGVVLVGTEVKSLRQGKCNLKDSYVRIVKGEAYIFSMHISAYEHGNIYNKDPLRDRKLLLHKKQIRKLFGLISKDGYTIVPTKIYLKDSLVKLEIAIAKGKKLYDKRDSISSKESKREIERNFKEKNRI